MMKAACYSPKPLNSSSRTRLSRSSHPVTGEAPEATNDNRISTKISQPGFRIGLDAVDPHAPLLVLTSGRVMDGF